MSTEDKLQAHLNGRIKTLGGYNFKETSPRITCANGATLSVQTGSCLYCLPRQDTGPWLSVEVGFPSEEPPETWAEHFDGDWATEDRTDSVYAYVPINLVAEYIDAHGGMK